MADRVVAQRHVVAVGDHSFVALVHGQRDKVVSLALQRGRGGIRHGGHHALQVGLRDGDLSRSGVADSIRSLRDGGQSDDLRRGARNRRCCLRHELYSSGRGSCQLSAVSFQCLPPAETPSRYNREQCLALNRLLYFYEVTCTGTRATGELSAGVAFVCCVPVFGDRRALDQRRGSGSASQYDRGVPGDRISRGVVLGGIALLVAIVIEVRYQSRKRIESRLM